MGENTLYKRFLPLVILTVGILLQGCKDDVFNPEKVKAAYQDRFPVKNIDPAMDWKMTQQVRVNVSVNPEKPDVPLNKNDAFQKVQKRRVQEKR